MKTSRDADADALFHEAEFARKRADRASDGLRFPSVLAALGWYWEKRATLSSPQGMHPRTSRGPDGRQVWGLVEGGRGGDFDEVLATVTTIGRALARLHEDFPMAYRALVLTARDGRSQAKAAQMMGVSQGRRRIWWAGCGGW